MKEFTESYQNSQKLQLYDIFIIGYYAMNKGYNAISVLWLEEAYNRYHLYALFYPRSTMAYCIYTAGFGAITYLTSHM